MDRRAFLKTLPALTALSGIELASAGEAPPGGASAAEPPKDPKTIDLPKPQTEGGKSVLAALKERKTIRNIKPDPLPPQMLSDLLWAAFGVNRESGPTGGRIGRTAASASNSQEIDLFVLLPEGAYLYEVVPHRLAPVAAGDLRARAGRGRRGSGGMAPVRIVFVADIAKYARAPFQEPGLRDPEIQKSYSNIAVGLIAGNVYLFAASQGLAAWFHNCDKEGLAKELKLRPEQRVLYAQTVGYPA
jgi:nitroreductase